MTRALLISTSTTFGTGYLDHAEAEIGRLLEGLDRILFVPWALADCDAYAAKARERFGRWGVELTSIHDLVRGGSERDDAHAAVNDFPALFIGGGNTFRLLTEMYRHDMIDAVPRRVAEGLRYMGTSARSNMACPTIRTTNDMPIVQPPSFEALGLIPFQINPHYLDADPTSKHMGETRETRLREFHEENDVPVVGLREGAMLDVRGETVTLLGESGARLFRRGVEPVELADGTRVDELLA